MDNYKSIENVQILIAFLYCMCLEDTYKRDVNIHPRNMPS